ncbi:hypothetical protein C6497_11340 [Candidatus Poribacteria bacterium]|nr:MAG: hypothetical protein C6497_11340 [Candidatus Poribacteria bacterium]
MYQKTFSAFPEWVALGTSVAFSPFIVPIVTAVIVIQKHAMTSQDVLLWLGIVTLFVTILPILGIVLLVKFSKVGNLHLHAKEERIIPLCFIVLSMILGTVILYKIGAAQKIILACIAFIANSIVFSAITPLWKISFHTSVTTGCIMVLVFLVNTSFIWFFLLIPLIAWARIYRERHTFLQTVVGTLLAIINTALVFHFLQ